MSNGYGRRNKKSRAYIRRQRRIRIIVIILVLLLIFCIFLGVRACASVPYESIDLCRLVKINYGGYNNAGTAEAVIDDAAVDRLLTLVKEDYYDATLRNSEVGDEDYLKFRQSLVCNLSKTEGLSNGSVISVNCSYDKELAKKLKIEVTKVSGEVTVSGLPTVTKLSVDQLFEGLSVDFEGISPNMTMSMANNSTNPFIKQIGFEVIDPKEFYSEGDVVRIHAVYTDEQCLESKYIVDAYPEDCVKEYVAEADVKYISDVNDLPASVIKEAVAEGKKAFKDANEYGVRIFCEANLVPVYINKKATFVYGTPKYVSSYFKSVFPEKSGEIGLDYNDLDIIYSVVISQADGVSCTAYAAVRFSNIIVYSDGSCEYDFSNPKILSESYFSERVKKNVTESYANTHDITRVYE